MIVEFVGCSGSGKTTLSNATARALDSECQSYLTPFEYFLGKTICSVLPNETCRFLLLDIITLPLSLVAAYRHWNLLAQAMTIWRNANSPSLTTILLLRSVIRKLTLHDFFSRSRFNNQLVLVDEGTLNIPQVILANIETPFSSSMLKELTDQIPLPNISIYIDTPIQVLLDRVTMRTDPPLRGVDTEALRHFIRRAYDVFQQMHSLGVFEKVSKYICCTSEDLNDVRPLCAVLLEQLP